MNRRHDIDALRALAFALLILYHLGMLYVAGWGFGVAVPKLLRPPRVRRAPRPRSRLPPPRPPAPAVTRSDC